MTSEARFRYKPDLKRYTFSPRKWPKYCSVSYMLENEGDNMVGPDFHLTVAVSGERNIDQRLLKYGEALCHRSGVRMHIVHVYPFYPRTSSSELSVQAEEQDEAAVLLAGETLAAYRELISPEINVTSKVLRGDVVDEILNELESQRSDLLLVGSDAYNVFAESLSLTLSLLRKTNTPTLVLPNVIPSSVERGEIRMIVADDLRVGSEKTLSFAVKVAEALGNARVIDAHVENLQSERVSTAFLKVYMAALGSSEVFRLSNDRLPDSIRAELKKHMDERLSELKSKHQDSDVSFQTMVLEGKTVQALKDSIERIRADILIFGRHKAFSEGGSILGGIKEKEMLSFGIPVLVVP
jgi:nucleotide-binding universal stress UspA family protein